MPHPLGSVGTETGLECGPTCRASHIPARQDYPHRQQMVRPGALRSMSWGWGLEARKRTHGASILCGAERGLATQSTDDSSSSGLADLCNGGLPDNDVCNILESSPIDTAVLSEAWARGRWLLGLLVLQSTSSFVLDNYQQLLKDHIVVTLFLTMLVGAGGNAGNQSSIKVIRGLATGSLQPTVAVIKKTLWQQAQIGLILGGALSVGGFVRVYLTNGNVANAAAISTSLFLIVMTSVVAGTALPFALAKGGADPANAGTSIQVIMDVLGVAITCATCHFVLDQLVHSL